MSNFVSWQDGHAGVLALAPDPALALFIMIPAPWLLSPDGSVAGACVRLCVYASSSCIIMFDVLLPSSIPEHVQKLWGYRQC